MTDKPKLLSSLKSMICEYLFLTRIEWNFDYFERLSMLEILWRKSSEECPISCCCPFRKAKVNERNRQARGNLIDSGYIIILFTSTTTATATATFERRHEPLRLQFQLKLKPTYPKKNLLDDIDTSNTSPSPREDPSLFTPFRRLYHFHHGLCTARQCESYNLECIRPSLP